MTTGDVTNMRRQVGRWRIAVIVLCVLVIALVIALAVVASKLNSTAKDRTTDAETAKQSANDCISDMDNINLNPPAVLTPFHDLTKEEIHNIKDYLYHQRDLNLVRASEIAVNKSYIFTMEIRVPNKVQTLNYLDRNQQRPDREATVMIFRGDLATPQVEEYTVGPLPQPSYKKGPVKYPFKYRPFTWPEWVDMVEKVSKEVQEVAGDLLWESYKGKMLGHCDKQCLGFQLNIPESPGVTGNTQRRRYWLWMFQVVEYFSLHPLDFLVLTDVTGTSVDQYEIVKVIYAGKTFDSLKDLMAAYNKNEVLKIDIPFPDMDDNLYSSMHRRGKLFPENEKGRPLQFEPDGKRYSINGRQITYMNWQMHVRLSPINGPQIYDIRYNGERIIYEMSIQEIGAYYSAHNPAHRFSDFADSFFMFGTQARTLVTGADCPSHATYLSATYTTESSEEATVIDRAFCVFEHNTETPLRRHNVRTSFEGNKFYEGMQDVVFIVRTIMTVVNYDYVLDFVFHQNGAVEVKIISTGYILTSFRMPKEEQYGFRLRDTIVGNMHHHMFHFKVDMDIKGTSNRYETLDIIPEAADNTKWSTKPNAKYHQTKLVPTPVRYEKDAALRYDFSTPKYLIFYNNKSRSDYGVPRAYRLLMRGMSKQMITKGEGQERAVPWARYQMAVTKHKETERRSSSVFAIWDGAEPVVNFQSFIDDNESIEDVDQVTWITMGIHHIPHMEDLPTTPTVGLELKFFLLPNNYFDEDPAIGSRDAIRIDPRDQKDIYKGFDINRYGRDESRVCKPVPTKFDEEIQENPVSMFDVE